MNEQVIDFLKGNPNSNKAAITAATGVKGLPLFNILKRLQTDGQIISTGEGNNATYSVNENYTEDQIAENQAGGAEAGGSNEPVMDEGKEEDAVQPPAETKTAKASAGRDNTKFIFEKETYGKGKLVVAVLKKYVADNQSTYKQLAEKFPPSLMKRYSVFEEIGKAKELSGTRDRYFFKPEDVIKLADKKSVVVCSQWTSVLIAPFIETAKKLGYKIK